RQEHTLERVVELGHVTFDDEPLLSESCPELLAQLSVVCRVGAAVVVELDLKTQKVPLMSCLHVRDQRLFGASLLVRANHDGGAVRVVRAHVDGAMPTHPLEPNPNV